jgi:hypothetical protein
MEKKYMRSNSLRKALEEEGKHTYTENGMQAKNTSEDALVDLFASIGGLRNRSEQEIQTMFQRAFDENQMLAVKMSFYARDIRNGGIAERHTPKIIWRYLALRYPDVIRHNIANIVYFGRFDDLYCLIDTPVEPVMWEFMRDQFNNDIIRMNKHKPISLAAKWMKSVNASSAETCALGHKTALALHLTDRDYRKTLSRMRHYLEITETYMSNNHWKSALE